MKIFFKINFLSLSFIFGLITLLIFFFPNVVYDFYSFDAEVALSGLAEGPFLSELVSDILLEDMMDQVDRGYLTL